MANETGWAACRHGRIPRGAPSAAALLLFILTSAGCLSSARPPEHLRDAEALTRQGELAEAVESYRRHIEYRLTVDDRPAWENPWFYLLVMGDLELRQGNVAEALAYWTEAETRGIEPGLVSDRFRSAATWLEQHNRLEEAYELLTKYRERDPLLIDAMLDRLARELTAREDRSSPAAPVLKPPPTPAD